MNLVLFTPIPKTCCVSNLAFPPTFLREGVMVRVCGVDARSFQLMFHSSYVLTRTT